MTAGGKRPGAGAPKKDKTLISKSFRVDEEAFLKAQELFPKTLSKKVNEFIRRLAKKAP